MLAKQAEIPKSSVPTFLDLRTELESEGILVSGVPDPYSFLNGRYTCDDGKTCNQRPLFRKQQASGVPDNVYLRRLRKGMWAFNSRYAGHDPKLACVSSAQSDKPWPQDVTTWNVVDNNNRLKEVAGMTCTRISAATVQDIIPPGTLKAGTKHNADDDANVTNDRKTSLLTVMLAKQAEIPESSVSTGLALRTELESEGGLGGCCGASSSKQHPSARQEAPERCAFQCFFRDYFMREHKIPGDGNCFFVSVAHATIMQKKIETLDQTAIDNDFREALSHEIRLEAVQYMKSNEDEFAPWFGTGGKQDDLYSSSASTFADYLTRMRDFSAHADGMVVKAVAKLRTVDIQVYKFDDTDGIVVNVFSGVPAAKGQDDQDVGVDQDVTTELLETPNTLRVAYYAHQQPYGNGHYNCIIAQKVCERSLDPCLRLTCVDTDICLCT